MKIMPLTAIWMELEFVMLSEVSQTKRNIMQYHLYVESKKNDTNALILNTNRFTNLENELKDTRENVVWGRDSSGVWNCHVYTLLYLKWIINKDLLYITGSSAQYYVTN